MTDTAELRRIELKRYPLRLAVRSRSHFEELVREFQLVDIGRKSGEAAERPVPHRLIELVDTFTQRYADRVDAIEAQRSAAIARGEIEMDLAYDAPVDAREGVVALTRLMEECDAFCASDEYLLTLATPPDVVAFRRWNVAQIVTQIDGGAPTPWPGEL
ncbi:MAG: hypothetical protein QOG49_183 [Frankiaceae bacterium]|nr:hypothetical protein [Frankiaceae bacterium]